MMGGVWVSNDTGKNWRQENNSLGSTSMTSVRVRDDHIYASTQGSGVYSGIINADGSITWINERSNKPKAYVYRIQIEVDPQDSNRIYASAYPGGLLRSDDGGKNWNDKNFLTPSIKVDDPSIQGYYSFDINPQDPSNIWLGVYGKGTFVSYDGMDFDMFASGSKGTMMGKHITSVKINPQNPDEIYVGTQEGVFVSRDRGITWESLNDGLDTLDIRSIKLVATEILPFEDDFDDGNLDKWIMEDEGWSIISDEGNNILSGSGHSWINAGLDSWEDYTFESQVKLLQGLVHVNFRVSDEGRYFLGFSEGGLYLGKQFNQWSEFTDLISIEQFHTFNQWYDLKVVIKDSNIKVYIDGVLEIDYTDTAALLNGAIAFEVLEESQVFIDNVSVSFEQTYSEPIVYIGTAGYGIYKYDPAENKWVNLGRTLGTGWWSPWERRMYQFSSILFDTDIPGKIYCGHFPGGFFISEDNGHSWQDSSIGLGNDGMFSITMHPDDSNILFAGTYNGVVKSVDQGRSWETKSNGMEAEQWPYTVAIDSNNTNVMYASTKNGENKGFCHRNDFCGVVMKSIDGGENWFKIMSGLEDKSEFYTLIIYPPDHNILFLSTNRGVYLSRNAGTTWKPINNGLPSLDNQVRENVADNLALTPDNRHLILGLMNYGVWKLNLAEIN
jgi:photosystem II stability/assembly factor-like uncharacterized protein